MSGPSEADLIRDFEIELEILCDAWEGIGIFTKRLRANIEKYGAVATAKRYGGGPQQEQFQEGLKKALSQLGPEMTIEGLIVEERFRPLFKASEIEAARARLSNPL